MVYTHTETDYISVGEEIPIPEPDSDTHPTPPVPITGGNNPGDGTITYQLNSVTAAEDVGSRYEHLMTLHSLTNYDLLTSPNYVLSAYDAMDVVAKTITNSTATWDVNCYSGLPVFVVADTSKGVRCYGVVDSNTADTLTLSTMMYESDTPTSGFLIVFKNYDIDFQHDIASPSAIANFDVNSTCFEFSDNDDKRKLSTRIVATGKDVFGKTISVMVEACHAFDVNRQFFNESTVVRKRSEGYINKNNYVLAAAQRGVTAVATPSPAQTFTTNYAAGAAYHYTIYPADYGELFVNNSPVVFSEDGIGGTVPAGLTAGTTYYVRDNGVWGIDSFSVCSAVGGAAIDLLSDAVATCYAIPPGGLIMTNTDGFLTNGQEFVLFGTTAPTGLVLGDSYTNGSATYSSATYFINCGTGVGAGGSGLSIYKYADLNNPEMGTLPAVWLYGWQYTIPTGSSMSFCIPNSGIAGVATTTLATPIEFNSSNSENLTLVYLTAFPISDFSGKGYLLNKVLYVDDYTVVGENEVMIGEEKITIDHAASNATYGHYIQFTDPTTRVTSSTLKAYPHDVGALVARTTYTAAAPETGSAIADYGLLVDNRTVDGAITYGALDTYASSLLLGFGNFYKIATTWCPLPYGIVLETGRISDGTYEPNRTRLIRAGDRISFTKFTGATPDEYEVAAVTIKCDEGTINLELGDFEKNPYTSLMDKTNAVNRTLT